MTLIIFAIIILAFGFVSQSYLKMEKVSNYIKIGGMVLLVFALITSTIKQIEPGTVGVQSVFGKVNNNVLESGLHFINPFAEVTVFDIRTLNYTMSGVHDEGAQSGDDAIRVLTADGLEVVIDLTILYRVLPNEAPNILRKIGPDFENTVVRPIARTKIRDNAVYYNAVSMYSDKRDEFQARIFKDIEKDFKDRGLYLEQLLVRNVTLPVSVKASIESKINAEQDAQKMEFVLQKEKQEAERKRVEAQGISDYQRIISLQLTESMLKYEMIKAYKEMALSPNSKIIVMGDGKGSAPVIIDGK